MNKTIRKVMNKLSKPPDDVERRIKRGIRKNRKVNRIVRSIKQD